jgi:ATP-dependent DNA ligase
MASADAPGGADNQVRLQSRQGRGLTYAFPEIAAAVAEQCAPGTVLDGEIVCWQNGALDFTALLGRLGGARTPGACLAVFDLLADAGRDLRGRPYLARRARLCEVLDDCELPLLVVPHTQDRRAALGWLTDHADAGIEGVVAKRIDQHYNVARNAWWKIRNRLSDEAVIIGVIGDLAEPAALVLGRLDARARLRIAPLPRQARAQLGRHLRRAAEPPWLATLRPRFGERGPLTYTRVQPHVVVELEVDTARDHGRWRHPVIFRRIRAELRPEDLPRGPCSFVQMRISARVRSSTDPDLW